MTLASAKRCALLSAIYLLSAGVAAPCRSLGEAATPAGPDQDISRPAPSGSIVALPIDPDSISQGIASEPARDAPGQAEGSPQEWILNQARRDLLAGRLEAARLEIEEFNANHADSAEGLYLEGEVLLRQNRARDSLRMFTKAAAVQTPSGAQLRLVGLDYVLLNDYPDAVRWLERSVKLAPADGESWYALGRARYSTGDFHAAETDFARALTLAPASAKLLDNLGLTYVAEGEPEKALGAYRRAIAVKQPLATRSEQPLLDYGALLIQMGDAEGAQEPLTEAVSIAPGCAACHETLGRALLANHRTAEAAAQMQTAVTLQPKNPRFHFELGRIYKQAGDQARATAEFEESAKLYGSRATAPN